MLNIEDKTKKTVKLEKVPQLEFFKLNDTSLFLRTGTYYSPSDGVSRIVCVDMHSGETRNFDPDHEVHPVVAKLIIEGYLK